jgi:hypothetical protein
VQIDAARHEQVAGVVGDLVGPDEEQLVEEQQRRALRQPERAPVLIAGTRVRRADLGLAERDRQAGIDEQVQHHEPLLHRRADDIERRGGRLRMERVDHERGRAAAGEHNARDPQRRLPRRGAQLGRDVRLQWYLADVQVADAELDGPSPGERRVGLQALEPLVQRGGVRHAPDERPAALTADDLTGVREAPQRGAQRPTRDAEHRGEIVLGWEAIALAMPARREPGPQGLLRAVDERRARLG